MKPETTLPPPFLRHAIWFGLGVLLTVATILGFEAFRYWRHGHPTLPPVATALPTTAIEEFIDEKWLLEGSPTFRTTHFFHSLDGRMSAGLWEAIGPAKFEWHYDSDETVLVLEGGARLTYGGQISEVVAGSRVFFRAGEVVIWEVPQRIKKTWVLHDPGRVARRLRPILRQ